MWIAEACFHAAASRVSPGNDITADLRPSTPLFRFSDKSGVVNRFLSPVVVTWSAYLSSSARQFRTTVTGSETVVDFPIRNRLPSVVTSHGQAERPLCSSFAGSSNNEVGAPKRTGPVWLTSTAIIFL